MAERRPAALIVDDEAANCRLLAKILGDQGYHCETAANAVEALAKLKDRTFELALLDYKMPGMSGLDLLTIMADSYPGTMTIMITAVNEAAAAVEALRRGARAYLMKPFRLDEIGDQVAGILKADFR